ncbi:MAG: translation elongation factor Ts [Deltaproteobacteria bacterium]
MANISAKDVAELRKRTGAGMMDCKNALVEAGGDTAKALEVIQKKGLAKAVKAAGRIAADGAIVSGVSADGQHGVLVEVNCQTDFVSRGEEFRSYAESVAKAALENAYADVEALNDHSVGGKSLREHAEALTAKSGEKHAIRRMQRFDVSGKGIVASYIHHGARLGVLVEINAEKGTDPVVKEFANEVALQIASMGPKFVRKEDAPVETIEKQREIFVAQMKNEDDETVATFEDFKRRADEEGGEHSDKVKEHLKSLEKKAATAKSRPEVARLKILEGKLAKWLNEMTLLEQVSVKDSSKTIKQLLTEFSGAQGKTEIKHFARFELGEGVDKGPAKDFATEVAEMTAASQKQ